MAGWTNKGKATLLSYVFRGVSLPANFYIALCTSAVTPNADTNTLGQLTQIAAGNGYTANGIALSKNATDFDVLNEDDAGDLGAVQIKDVVWTAAGGNMPGSGSGARYAVLTDDNATPGNRLVLFYWDLTSDRVISDGQTLTLRDLEIRVTEG